MTALAQLQQQFIEVIQGGDTTELSKMIATQGSVDTLTRIDIYRNAYQLRLTECIETDHEILGFFLGDDLFDEMVAGYIKAYPSQHVSLRYYCEKLPVFLAQTLPFSEHPVIAELAQFERYLLTAFDAADSGTLSVNMLKQVIAEDWPELLFRLHPSVQLFRAHFNSVEIWQSLKQQQTPPAARSMQNNWLIWRNSERLTEFSSLKTYEYFMLECILQGTNYAGLCELLTDFIPEDEVGELSLQSLVNWLSQGVIRSLSIGHHTEPFSVVN